MGSSATPDNTSSTEDRPNGIPQVRHGSHLAGRDARRQERVFYPVDGVQMARMVNAARPPFRVESCPVCHGTSLDAGEFTNLKEHALGELLRPQPSERTP